MMLLAQTSISRGALECSCVTTGKCLQELGFLLALNYDDNDSDDDDELLFILLASLTNQRHSRDCLEFKLLSEVC